MASDVEKIDNNPLATLDVGDMSRRELFPVLNNPVPLKQFIKENGKDNKVVIQFGGVFAKGTNETVDAITKKPSSYEQIIVLDKTTGKGILVSSKIVQNSFDLMLNLFKTPEGYLFSEVGGVAIERETLKTAKSPTGEAETFKVYLAD